MAIDDLCNVVEFRNRADGKGYEVLYNGKPYGVDELKDAFSLNGHRADVIGIGVAPEYFESAVRDADELKAIQTRKSLKFK